MHERIDDPWELGVGGIINPEPVDPAHVPELVLVAQLLFAHRARDQVEDNSKVHWRALKALHFLTADATTRLAELHRLRESEGDVAPLITGLGEKPDRLRLQIHKKLPDVACLGLLIEGAVRNPFAPFRVFGLISEVAEKVGRDHDDVRANSLAALARDMGCPASWSGAAMDAIKAAKGAQRNTSPWGWVLTIAGVALVIAALPLAVAFAPAGLAGGAAVLSGLATLGGAGGLMGGIAVVSAVGAIGGSAAMAGAFVIGSPKEVEQLVIILHATAIAKRDLRPGSKSFAEQGILTEMKEELNRQIDQHEEVDGKKSGVAKNARAKLKSVDRAIQDLEKRGLMRRNGDGK